MSGAVVEEIQPGGASLGGQICESLARQLASEKACRGGSRDQPVAGFCRRLDRNLHWQVVIIYNRVSDSRTLSLGPRIGPNSRDKEAGLQSSSPNGPEQLGHGRLRDQAWAKCESSS